MGHYPALFQINTRVWLRELVDHLGRSATLADIPDEFLDQIAAFGFDYIWFLGLWQTGPAGREVSLSHPEWLEEFQATLPDFTEADVSGSPFAVTGYTLHRDYGQEADLLGLKKRLQSRSLKLVVDFVPITRPRIIPGFSSIPSSMSRGVKPTWSGNLKIIGGWKPVAARSFWPTAGTPISLAGPTPSSSTIGIRPLGRASSPMGRFLIKYSQLI